MIDARSFSPGIAAVSVLSFAVAVACAHERPNRVDISASVVDDAVERFIGLYAARKDMRAFVSLFRNDGVLADRILNQRFVGPEAIAGFYDWDAPGFGLVDPTGPVLHVDARTIDGARATLRGHFLPFR